MAGQITAEIGTPSTLTKALLEVPKTGSFKRIGNFKKKLDRLVSVPHYEGILMPDNKVQIMWNIGINKVSLATWLCGAVYINKIHKERNDEYTSYLHVPLDSLLKPKVKGYYDQKKVEELEKQLAELEEIYPIRCFICHDNVSGVQHGHYESNTFK